MARPPVRTILHLDLDAFFCAVEEQRNPALRGKPFAVGARPEERGVVSSCSYAARRFGIRSALPMAQAVRLCPELIIVPPHFEAYRAASRRVMERLHALTPLVEQISIDEAFMDVTGIPEAGYPLARRLQAQINAELDLPCSFGVASNKLVAKIANNIGKRRAQGDAPPNAIEVVPAGEEAAFLAPLPVDELWGVGPRTAERLRSLGVTTIGELAAVDPERLKRLFGKHGAELAERARGIDARPVQPEHEAKSISKETTFARDISDGAALRRTLRRLSADVGYRLRREGMRGLTVRVKLRWADFTTITRQTTLERPIDQDDELYAAALETFEAAWPQGRPVRLIGVGIASLVEAEGAGEQLSLWGAGREPGAETARRLQAALDALRDRYGEDVIRRGSDLQPRADEDAP